MACLDAGLVLKHLFARLLLLLPIQRMVCAWAANICVGADLGEAWLACDLTSEVHLLNVVCTLTFFQRAH
jgi:hypothetical protein